MATTQSPKVPRMRQARKSLAHVPSTVDDKENSAVDSAPDGILGTQIKQVSKKARSKSLGPGGLDALKEDVGNKRELALPPNFKSILKPTIVVTPPKSIPPRKGSHDASPSKANGRKTPERSPAKSPRARSIDSSVLEAQSLRKASEASPKADASKRKSPSGSPARVAVRTEEEQQAAAKQRERQELLAHRDARRKSLANRRVSFAPEATLHTWDVVELPEDSTTSSASTNATRRASGLTANAGSPFKARPSHMPSSDASEPPSTPPEQAEELQVAASPIHQRDLHQKKRRRSSGIPPLNFNNPDDFSSSPFSGASDGTDTQTYVTADEDSSSSSSNNDDLVEDETVTGVDADDNTVQSAGGSSTSSSGRLEAALKQAANQAGTQGIDYDEHGDITMEMADDEVTAAFKPWVKKGQYIPQVIGDPSALQDQENLNPFSPAFKANVNMRRDQEDDGTMDITQAVGGILSNDGASRTSPKRRSRISVAGPGRPTSEVGQLRSPSDGADLDDETMDLTTAIGGIETDHVLPGNNSGAEPRVVDEDEDEELTMEFTSVIGGVVEQDGKNSNVTDIQFSSQRILQDANRRESVGSSFNEEDMDITYAAGGILPSITERTEPIEDRTMDMDITAAVGNILPKQQRTGTRSGAKALMERETDIAQPAVSPFGASRQKPNGAGLSDERPLPARAGQIVDSPFGTRRQNPVGVGLSDERVLPAHARTVASDTGSPSLTNTRIRNPPPQSRGPRTSVTPKSQRSSPVKKPNTPTKQLTSQPMRPTTPGKTPPSKNVTMRTASPKKLFKGEIRAEANQSADADPALDLPNSLFNEDAVTGATTPNVLLKPRRRSSGLGVDREGLGSPRVTALLDRRGSIGDQAKVFVPQGRVPATVRFENPQVIEQELNKEREEDEQRETGREILQTEADAQDLGEEKDATTNLKDKIESLTPQKKKLNGRKSLHVGAARGLLGKRPVELDEEEDEDDYDTNIKGREGSPVKKVKLPGPPTKAAAMGRTTRSTRRSLTETSGNALASTPSGSVSPVKTNTTPKDQPRFKDAPVDNAATLPSFEQKLNTTASAIEPPEAEDRIQLQDFLNMTSIRFMELTTTKRRHTVLPNAMLEQDSARPSVGAEGVNQVDEQNNLESCVVAGACTVPMLELYQHSCRELKNYISEGRSVVKEIEADTYEENPPLFREYMAAPPDVKSIMDNQFKNVKTHARLLSKAMWYEWRMKLLDGLKEGLLKIGEGMDEDNRSLIQQEQILQPVLPSLIESHDRLENQVQIAQEQADELADCDQDELREARESLNAIESELDARQNLLERLQSQLREQDDGLADTIERKQECFQEIEEAEKVRQNCRGWSYSEVSALQANVDALVMSHGWIIASATESALTMTYDGTLQLFFTPSSFKTDDNTAPTASENSPISLTYIADTHERHAQPLTTEKRFFLQIMRVQLQCLQQSHTKIKDLLAFVSNSWKSASNIAEEARILGINFITEPTITSDEVMAVQSIILLRAMRTKVEVSFEVKVRSGGDGVATALGVGVKSSARVCYGEGLKEKKMAEFLDSKIAGKRRGTVAEQGGAGCWAKAVGELEKRLVERGKK